MLFQKPTPSGTMGVMNKAMKPVKYKALTHAGVFVNEQMLGKGIYASHLPKLYTSTETIEHLIEFADQVRSMSDGIVTDAYIENLAKCKLTDVELTIKP